MPANKARITLFRVIPTIFAFEINPSIATRKSVIVTERPCNRSIAFGERAADSAVIYIMWIIVSGLLISIYLPGLNIAI